MFCLSHSCRASQISWLPVELVGRSNSCQCWLELKGKTSFPEKDFSAVLCTSFQLEMSTILLLLLHLNKNPTWCVILKFVISSLKWTCSWLSPLFFLKDSWLARSLFDRVKQIRYKVFRLKISMIKLHCRVKRHELISDSDSNLILWFNFSENVKWGTTC